MEKKIRYIELFGGIGALTQALKNLEIETELLDYVEIDKYATKSFNTMNGTNFEPQDICEWDKEFEDVDLIMHGSPCQDFSLAGKQAGGDENSGTRSSLMYETLRIVEKLKPKYVIWENVKNVLSKKHKHNFDTYIYRLEQLGYKSYYQVLNAKDYGIPQNRERVFTISILSNDEFTFPNGNKCNNVTICLNSKGGRGGVEGLQPSVQDRIYDAEGISTAITTCFMPKVAINYQFPPKKELKLKLKDILEDEVDETYYEVCPSMIKALEDRKVKDITNSEFSCTLTTKQARWNNAGMINRTKIRYLTPKECWRLMGFSDEVFEKAAQVNSNTQLYKQAGNSIVVPVLEAILTNLLLDKK